MEDGNGEVPKPPAQSYHRRPGATHRALRLGHDAAKRVSCTRTPRRCPDGIGSGTLQLCLRTMASREPATVGRILRSWTMRSSP